jgi:uncharacterized protein CbrC (UPF0167 family)
MDLPKFTYHPDPVFTGSIVESAKLCRVCGLARGYIYVGPVYCSENLNEAICPWCISSGKANREFNAEFVDRDLIGGGTWETVERHIVEEVAFRTPGFNGWQQERWFTHCGDAGVFLGPNGRSELEAYGAQAMVAIQEESGFCGEDWKDYFQSLDRNHGPTAYLFLCRHCGVFGGYSDIH